MAEERKENVTRLKEVFHIPANIMTSFHQKRQISDNVKKLLICIGTTYNQEAGKNSSNWKNLS